MASSGNAELSDLEKVLESLSFITSIRSLNDVFEVFGLATLPTAQKYGIFFGILTFTLTVGTVFALLILGGSFKRIVEQETGVASSIPSAIEERVNRPLLLERLLESQERMVKKYPADILTEGLTALAKMLMNVAPDVAKAQEAMATLIEEDDMNKKENEKDDKKSKEASAKRREELKKFIPEGYEANYIKAYRKCQDKPGGMIQKFDYTTINFSVIFLYHDYLTRSLLIIVYMHYIIYTYHKI